MKRFLQFASILLIAGLVACQCDSKEETPPVPPPDPTPVTPPDPGDDPGDDPVTPPEPEPVKPEPGVYTFVLPDYAPKAAWSVGDEISIRGNSVAGIITATVTEGSISEDGKTATLELAEIPATFCPPDYLYAAFPAGDVNFEGTFCNTTTRFTGHGPRLVAFWKEGNSFEFVPCAFAVTFTVTGDYDAIVFAGAAREEILCDHTTVDYSSTTALSTKRPSDGHPFIVLDPTADGHYAVFIPGKTQIKTGFNIYLKKGDSYPMYYTHSYSGTVKAGNTLELGDITSSLTAYDGPAPEEMDMPVILKRTEYKVNVQELSGICLTEDGGSLWAVGDEGQLAIVTITDEGQVSVQNIKHYSNDLEGVTRDPATGDLYFCQEPNGVYRCPSPYTSYTRIFKVADAANYGNSGLEGITWYKDNTLYVGSQVSANLWRYDLTGNVLDFISLKNVKANIVEVGGLCYDPVNDWLWVTDSESHSLWVFSGDARTYYGRYKLSSSYNNESVTVDHARGCVWVGDDNDDQPRIIRLDMEGLTRPIE